MRQVVKILPNRGLYRVNLATYAAYMGDGRNGGAGVAERSLDQSPGRCSPWRWHRRSRTRFRKRRKPIVTWQITSNSGRPTRRQDWATWRCTKAASRTPAAFSPRAPRPRFAAKDRGSSGRTSLPRSPTPSCSGTGSPRRLPPPRRRWRPARPGTIRFLAARVLVEAGAPQRAKPIAVTLGNDLLPESQAYGVDPRRDDCVGRRRQPQRRSAPERSEHPARHLDWPLRVGPRLPEANQFLQADSEFDRCITRRGEALALFLDDEPTFGYFPAVHYYQGRCAKG